MCPSNVKLKKKGETKKNNQDVKSTDRYEGCPCGNLNFSTYCCGASTQPQTPYEVGLEKAGETMFG